MARRKGTTTKKQVVIGKQEYLNHQTGEVEQFNVINTYDTDFNFEKIWLSHILESLEVIGNQKIKVLNWLLNNKNSDNQIIATQRIISEKSGVSYPVVNQTIKSLMDCKAIKSQQKGVYMLNPDFMFKGHNKKRMNLLLRFNQIEDIEQKKVDHPELEEKKNEENQGE